MKRLLAQTLMVALLASGPVLAAPSSKVAWTVETMKLVDGADAGKGKQLAQGCAGCHGAAGVSALPINPHTAGQDAAYTYKQLRDYKDGTRANPIMSGLAAGLSDQDMADIAAFYAEQSPAPPSGAGSDAAKELVTYGDGERLIPACSSCHGAKGEGNPRSKGMPVLAGQGADYLKQTMQAYRSGARANDVYSVMRSVAKDLTDEEIAALASYYAALGSK